MTQLYCPKCLVSRSEDVLGGLCKTPRCGGTIAVVPEFETLVDTLPIEFLCPRRHECGGGFALQPGPDHWQQFKSNGDRICSYCGSLHPDDFFRLVRAAADAPAVADYKTTVGIEPSDKLYKVYVHQPGVRNAQEGGIKFYMMHLPHMDGPQAMEYREAVRRTRLRFDLMMHGTE